MASVVSGAYGRDGPHGSRSTTTSHLLPVTVTVPGPALPSGSYPSTKDTPTCAVPLSCGTEPSSSLPCTPAGPASEQQANFVSERHFSPPGRHGSSTHMICSTKSSSGSNESSHNCNDSSSSSRGSGKDTDGLNDNKNFTWVNREQETNITSQKRGECGNKSTTSASPNDPFSSSTSTTSYGKSDPPSSGGTKESIGTNAHDKNDPKKTVTTGCNSTQFGSAHPCNASAWPPTTPSSVTADESSKENGDLHLFKADGVIPENQLRELRLLCRLIGLHSRPQLQKGQRINVYLHGSGVTTGKGRQASILASTVGTGGAATAFGRGLGVSSSFFLKRTGTYENPLGLRPSEEIKVVGGVDIGANTKCLFFLNDNEDHLYICFNWFDPKSVLDIVSLSCRLASTFRLHPSETSASFSEGTNLDQLPFLEAARRSALGFWSHPEFQELLQVGGAILRSSVPTTASVAGPGQADQSSTQAPFRPAFGSTSFSSNLRAITCGGFSIGGPTAFYVASLLALHVAPDVSLGSKDRLRIRAVAFGSPRFCGEKYVQWCKRHLAPSSCSVILYSTAQHYQQREHRDQLPEQHREQLQEQLQKHEQAWRVLSPQRSLTATDTSEQQGDKTDIEQRMILDPVCVQGSAEDGFVVQPNTVLLRVGGGLMRMGKEHEEEASLAAEEVTLKSSSIMWNMATRVSPFTKVYNERYAMLHSVLRYYEALADT